MKRQGLLALVGLVVGLGLGLLYAWLISPVQYTDLAPASLRADYQAEYIRRVAQAFVVEGDIERARKRLAALGETDPARTVTALAQRTAASGEDPQAVRSLAALASALGARPASPTASPSRGASPAPPSVTPEPTSSPIATSEPTLTPVPSPTASPQAVPTRTPTPTLAGVFNYVGKQKLCDSKLKQPLIQVVAMDSTGSPVPGIEVVVEWDGGFDHFFTGLKPEISLGYGDFTMAEGVSYAVHLVASPSAQVAGLTVEACTDTAGKSFPGSWLLVFRQS